MDKTRDEALSLLCDYTQSDSLIKHAFGVEAAMRWYANHLDEDIELWGITGLLHDFDYEKYPNPTEDGHPWVGSRVLSEFGYPPEIITAILGHAHYTSVPRESLMAKVLFACDELAGLITASVLVRPDKSIHNLTVQSVKKKMKDKAFARGVNRDDVIQGAQELAIDLDTHIGNVIMAMQAQASALGLEGLVGS